MAQILQEVPEALAVVAKVAELVGAPTLAVGNGAVSPSVSPFAAARSPIMSFSDMHLRSPQGVGVSFAEPTTPLSSRSTTATTTTTTTKVSPPPPVPSAALSSRRGGDATTTTKGKRHSRSAATKSDQFKAPAPASASATKKPLMQRTASAEERQLKEYWKEVDQFDCDISCSPDDAGIAPAFSKLRLDTPKKLTSTTRATGTQPFGSRSISTHDLDDDDDDDEAHLTDNELDEAPPSPPFISPHETPSLESSSMSSWPHYGDDNVGVGVGVTLPTVIVAVPALPSMPEPAPSRLKSTRSAKATSATSRTSSTTPAAVTAAIVSVPQKRHEPDTVRTSAQPSHKRRAVAAEPAPTRKRTPSALLSIIAFIVHSPCCHFDHQPR